MASWDVPVTSSTTHVKLKGNSDLVQIIEQVNREKYSKGIEPKTTKIPGPIRLCKDGNCYIQTSNRKYSSLMKSLGTGTGSKLDDSFSSTSTLVNTTEDSGLQMDCSTLDDEDISSSDLDLIHPNCSTPRPHLGTETIGITDSLLGLEEAEQQTLRVLQRAVAEMEADVAIHSEKLAEEIQLEQQKQTQPHKSEFDPEPQSSQPSKSCIVTATASERNHVRVEQLLGAENDIELLQKLLHTDIKLVDEDTVSLPQPFEDPFLNEKDIPMPGESVADEPEADQSEKPMDLWCSFLKILRDNGIRSLKYPLLLCGIAVGMILTFRRA